MENSLQFFSANTKPNGNSAAKIFLLPTKRMNKIRSKIYIQVQ